jgi:hypothetical protein
MTHFAHHEYGVHPIWHRFFEWPGASFHNRAYWDSRPSETVVLILFWYPQKHHVLETIDTVSTDYLDEEGIRGPAILLFCPKPRRSLFLFDHK